MSDPPPTVEEAEAHVAEKRQLGDGRHRPELAKALLDLSRAYEHADREGDALATARESIATLAPDFLAKPGWFAVPMRAVVAQYVALARRCGERTDEALLAPIAQALGDLTRAEDADDET